MPIPTRKRPAIGGTTHCTNGPKRTRAEPGNGKPGPAANGGGFGVTNDDDATDSDPGVDDCLLASVDLDAAARQFEVNAVDVTVDGVSPAGPGVPGAKPRTSPNLMDVDATEASAAPALPSQPPPDAGEVEVELGDCILAAVDLEALARQHALDEESPAQCSPDEMGLAPSQGDPPDSLLASINLDLPDSSECPQSTVKINSARDDDNGGAGTETNTLQYNELQSDGGSSLTRRTWRLPHRRYRFFSSTRQPV